MPKDRILDQGSAPSIPRVEPDTGGLLRAAADPALTEDLTLALLKRPDLPAEVFEQLAKNHNALKSRKVRIALVSHAHAPRHISLPLARQFYTFDLMKVALSSAAAADLKVAIEDLLISRLKAVTMGERLTLARRSSGRVAAALLLDLENESRDRNASTNNNGAGTNATSLATRVMQTALENPRLTEALVIKSVLHHAASAALVHAVAHHPKWSYRSEVRAALLRCAHLSLARALDFGGEIPASVLKELLANSNLSSKVKAQLLNKIE